MDRDQVRKEIRDIITVSTGISWRVHDQPRIEGIEDAADNIMIFLSLLLNGATVKDTVT